MAEDPDQRQDQEWEEEEEEWEEGWEEEEGEDYEGYYYDEATGQWVLEAEYEGGDAGTNGYDVSTGPQPSTPADDAKPIVQQNKPPPTSPLVPNQFRPQQQPEQVPKQQQKPQQQLVQVQPPREDPPLVVGGEVAESLRPAQTKEEADRLRSVLDRTYAFEDYEPRRNGWLADMATELFVSLGFKVYFGVLFLSAGALVSCIFLCWLTAVLCALFTPPIPDQSSFVQSFGLLVLFVFMSLVATSAFCTWTDALKQLWESKRTDSSLWGVQHPVFKSFARLCCRMCDDGDEAIARRKERQQMAREGTTHSPWLVHLIVVGGIGIVPFIVAIIQTGVNSGNIGNFINYLTFAGVMGCVCLQVILYVWFYIRAFIEKSRAYKRRKSVEDESKKDDGTPSKQRWYSSQVVLEELGLDRRTLRWSIVMLVVGLVPVFSIFASIALANSSENPPVAWLAIVVIFVCVMLFIMELASMKRYYRAVVVTMGLILLFAIAGLGCIGATMGAESVGLIVAFIIAAQFGLVRKRPHVLSRKEQCALMNVAIERQEDDAVMHRRKDTSFLFARNTIFACLSCLDIHTIFGYRHPKVVERERQLRRSRVELRVDYRVLVAHWWVLGIIGIVVLVGGQSNQEVFSSPVSTLPTTTSNVVPFGQSPFSLCGLEMMGSLNLTITDFAALAVLGRSTGRGHDVDFASWFSTEMGITRVSPIVVADVPRNTLGFVTLHHKASNTDILLTRTPTTVAFYSWFAGAWAPAISIGGTAYFSPVMWGWTTEQKESLVTLIGTVNELLLNHKDLVDSVSSLVESAKSTASNVVLVGDRVNGAYAKVLARKHGVHFVAFNAAGTSLSQGSFDIGDEQSPSFDVQSKRNPYRFVDADPLMRALVALLPCDSADDCVSSRGVFDAVLSQCGDSAGRGVSV